MPIMFPYPDERMAAQLEFVMEIDKLKQVLRRTLVLDRTRNENDAEHSWHVAMLALVLHEHAAIPKPDLNQVIRLLLVHDLVEIDAGDTFAYDAAGYSDKEEREIAAARRIFGMLPEDQADELMGYWREFEDGKSEAACFANALDRLQPLMHNYATEGFSWKQHGIRKSQVMARIECMRSTSPGLWQYAAELINQSVIKGYLKGDEADGTSDR